MLQLVAGLFKEQSYHGTTLCEIAQALDMSEATVTTLLGSKQDMLWEVTSRAVSLLLSQARSISHTLSAVGQFRTFVYRHMEMVVSERDYLVVFNRDWMFLDIERRRRIQTQRTTYEECLRCILAKGVQEGSLCVPDVDTTCAFVLTSLYWLVPWDVSVDTAAFAVYAHRYCLFLQRALCYESRQTPV
jgi:Transcriptional regulator